MIKKVSIIIPVYNAEKYIKECITHVLNQSYNDYEILIIDDGSHDSTKFLAKDIANNNNLIRYFYNNKKGVSSARNFGLSKANGEYIVFLDVDDTISPIFLECLVNMIESADNDCAIVSYTIEQDKLISNKNNSVDTENLGEKKYNLLIDSKYCVGGYVWNKIYKKAILEKYNIRFDENISVGEDLLFNFEYFKVSKNVVFKNLPLYFYKLNTSSAVNKLENKKWFDFIGVYDKLLKMHFKFDIDNYFRFLYSQIILEALYRIKFCQHSPYSKKELLKLKRKYTKLSLSYSLNQNLKIIFFKLFPNLAMKYKRKSIKEN